MCGRQVVSLPWLLSTTGHPDEPRAHNRTSLAGQLALRIPASTFREVGRETGCCNVHILFPPRSEDPNSSSCPSPENMLSIVVISPVLLVIFIWLHSEIISDILDKYILKHFVYLFPSFKKCILLFVFVDVDVYMTYECEHTCHGAHVEVRGQH